MQTQSDSVSQTPRIRTPEETLEVIKPWLTKAGVSRLADLSGMDCIGIPVYASIRPDSKSLAVDSGKGITKAHAKASAAMESLERWALDEVEVECLQPPYVGGLETRFPQIRGATGCTAKSAKACKASDLSTGGEALVPYWCVKLYDDSVNLQERIFVASTNGMASGNNRDEAIASGLFEVIERDAMNLAMASDNPPRCLVTTSYDQFTSSAIERIHKAGCELFAYDCIGDIGVPVFLAIIADQQRGVGLYKGYGCHLSPTIALNRAICEAAQARCVVMAGARDDVTWAMHRNIIVHTEDIDWVKRLGQDPFSTNIADMSDFSTGNTDGDIQQALAMLGAAGFGRTLVVDFPIEGAPFSCVKVLVPGLAGYKYLTGMTTGRVVEGRPAQTFNSVHNEQRISQK